MEITLAIIAFLGFVGSFPQFIGWDWRQIWRSVVQGIVPWEEVHRTVRDAIARSLERGHFAPDLIVGVGRGGLICAGLLCSELTGVELERNGQAVQHSTRIRLASIDTKATLRFLPSADASRTYSVEQIAVGEFEESVNGAEKVVLIVAQSFTGATLNASREKLIAKGIKQENIRTVSTFVQRIPSTQSAVYTPDICGKVISAKRTMPWKAYKVTTDRF